MPEEAMKSASADNRSTDQITQDYSLLNIQLAKIPLINEIAPSTREESSLQGTSSERWPQVIKSTAQSLVHSDC